MIDGISPDPPRACMNRSPMSTKMLSTRPQHKEATVNVDAKRRNILLRPMMSLNLPAWGKAVTTPKA